MEVGNPMKTNDKGIKFWVSFSFYNPGRLHLPKFQLHDAFDATKL